MRQQRDGECHELSAMLLGKRDRVAVGLRDHALDLLVDHLARALGERHVLARRRGGELTGARREAETHDGVAGDRVRALEVVGGARGDVPVDHVLGGAPAQQDHELLVHVPRRVQRAVAAGDHRHAARAAARDDRQALRRVLRLAVLRHESVARLVVGDGVALLGGQRRGTALRPGERAQVALGEVLARDLGAAVARGHDRGLVEHLAQVRARAARSAVRELHEIDVGCERTSARVHAEDREPALGVRQLHGDLAREAAGAQQRRVEHVEPVGGGDHHETLVAGEAVHLDQELVEGVFVLVVAAVTALAALAADGVELVDEDDRAFLGRPRPGEQLAHARCADAHVALDELGARRGEELDTRLGRQRLREQRLAGSGRAVQQQARRHTRADPLEALGIAEELDELGNLFDRLVAARDVGEGDARTGLLLDLRPGAQRPAGLTRTRLRLPAPVAHGDDHEDDREDDQPEEDVSEAAQAAARAGVHLDRCPGLAETVGEVLRGRVAERLLAAPGEHDADLRLARVERRLAHLAHLDRAQKVAVAVVAVVLGGRRRCRGRAGRLPGRRRREGESHHERRDDPSLLHLQTASRRLLVGRDYPQ